MKLRSACVSSAVVALILSNAFAIAQEVVYPRLTAQQLLASDTSSSSSSIDSGAGMIRPVPVEAPKKEPSFRPFSHIGLGWRSGIGGFGFDVATPMAKRSNLRTGVDFFGYSTSFQEQGANIDATLRMRAGHASLDWFPFGGRFRISPLLVFANNNDFSAKALIPAGNTITLNGEDYVSSTTDPLHGSGAVSFRKVAPGLTLGLGNIIPRTNRHFSFPMETGFYYVGQPGLNVAFTGSACASYGTVVGCQSVKKDPTFQKDLQAFVARNNHNLSYASFFPVLSFGTAYSF